MSSVICGYREISSFSQVSCEDDSRKIDLKKLKNKGIPFKISNCYLNNGPVLTRTIARLLGVIDQSMKMITPIVQSTDKKSSYKRA